MRWVYGMLLSLGVVLPAQAQVSGLDRVPADAFGFAHVRAAKLWNTDAMKEMRSVLQKAGPEALKAFDERFLPTPSSIEELTVILLMKADPKEPPSPLFIVTTNQPIDRAAMLKSMFGSVNKQPVKGSTVPLYQGEDNSTALFFLSDQSFAIGEPTGCMMYLLRKPSKTGPLAPALKFAADKDVTVAFSPALIPAQELSDLGPLAPFVKAKSVILAMTSTKEVVVDVKLMFGNAADAQDAEKATKMMIEMARAQMREMRNEMSRMVMGPPDRKGASSIEELPQAAAALFGLGMIGYYDEMLAKLPLKRSDSDLSMQMTIPEGPFTSVAAVSGLGVGMLLPAVQKVREAASRTQDQNNLKQMALAMHNYHDANNGFPPAAICDKKGKPLLSWRVAILPYIEEENLYRQFKLDEPWDSENNIKLLERMPRIYRAPASRAPANQTHYRVFVGNPGTKGQNIRTMFDVIRPTRITSITDGTSNSIMIATSEESVPWSKPDEMVCTPGQPLPKLATFYSGGSNVAFGDGSVRYLRLPIAEKTLRDLIGIDDGNVADIP